MFHTWYSFIDTKKDYIIPFLLLCATVILALQNFLKNDAPSHTRSNSIKIQNDTRKLSSTTTFAYPFSTNKPPPPSPFIQNVTSDRNIYSITGSFILTLFVPLERAPQRIHTPNISIFLVVPSRSIGKRIRPTTGKDLRGEGEWKFVSTLSVVFPDSPASILVTKCRETGEEVCFNRPPFSSRNRPPLSSPPIIRPAFRHLGLDPPGDLPILYGRRFCSVD